MKKLFVMHCSCEEVINNKRVIHNTMSYRVEESQEKAEGSVLAYNKKEYPRAFDFNISTIEIPKGVLNAL